MTDTEIEIAIAEACGWKNIHVEEILDGFPVLCGFDPKFKIEIKQAVPDYHNDLNAMAEARATLTTDAERSKYFEALHQIVGPLSDNPQWAMIDASARQHAEAFLKVKSLWRD